MLPVNSFHFAVELEHMVNDDNTIIENLSKNRAIKSLLTLPKWLYYRHGNEPNVCDSVRERPDLLCHPSVVSVNVIH